MDVFHDILTQGSESLSLAPTRLLVSLHRVLSADDCPKQDLVLADFITQVGLPKLLVRPGDAEADCYWEDRLSRGASHESAFHQLRQMASSSLGLAPILDSEPDMSAAYIKIEEGIKRE